MRRAILIYNPASGRQRSRQVLPKVLEALEAGGFEVEPRPTQAPHDATRLAREAREEGEIEVVFAMGGDGTLREAAAGLAGSEVALGLLPAGTANVLSLALGVPRDPLSAARAAADFVPRAIDLGRCDGEPFLMMASGGLDAAVMARQNGALKRWFGRLGLGFEALRQWWGYEYPEFELEVGGEVHRATFFSLSNIPLYGGGFRMAPGASVCDGRLDLVLFTGRGRRKALGFGGDLLTGRHLGRADVDAHEVESVRITSPRKLLLQLDGDVLTFEAPIELSVEPGGVRVLAPPC